MSSTNYTRWWRDGTIDVTKNSNAVTGTSTYWATANINPGDIMKINGVDYEIQSVTDNTHLTLATPYTGNAASGLGYAIIRNFTSTPQSKVAAQTSELMYDFAHFIDKEHATITGKNAYEVAKDNGYVGTEAQWLESLTAYGVAKKGGYTGTQAEWLESLKAAGEWTQAQQNNTTTNARIDASNERITELEGKYTYMPPVIYIRNADSREDLYARNAYPRFKNLGTQITDEQFDEIRRRRYNDMYIGDYWLLPVAGVTMVAIIVRIGFGCNAPRDNNLCEWYKPGTGDPQYNITHNTLHMALYVPGNAYGGLKMNDTNTTEGGYLASKVHTQTLPQLTNDLEAVIGEHHICPVYRMLPNTNQWNNLDELPRTKVLSKLELFSIYNVAPRENVHIGREFDESENSNEEYYPLFALPAANTYTLPFNIDTPLQENIKHPTRYATNYLSREGGSISEKSANSNVNLLVHFVLKHNPQ